MSERIARLLGWMASSEDERLAAETQERFSVSDLVVLDAVHRAVPVPDTVGARLPELLRLGAVERLSRSRYVLARGFYKLKGKPGEYTRRVGLDRETRKELLLKHIVDSGALGAPIGELLQVLPEMGRDSLRVLLRELRDEGRTHLRGAKRAARWFSGPAERAG